MPTPGTLHLSFSLSSILIAQSKLSVSFLHFLAFDFSLLIFTKTSVKLGQLRQSSEICALRSLLSIWVNYVLPLSVHTLSQHVTALI